MPTIYIQKAHFAAYQYSISPKLDRSTFLSKLTRYIDAHLWLLRNQGHSNFVSNLYVQLSRYLTRIQHL